MVILKKCKLSRRGKGGSATSSIPRKVEAEEGGAVSSNPSSALLQLQAVESSSETKKTTSFNSRSTYSEGRGLEMAERKGLLDQGGGGLGEGGGGEEEEDHHHARGVQVRGSRNNGSSSLFDQGCLLTKIMSVLFVLVFLVTESASGLKCYTDIEAKQIATCKESEGYRTCFTKYNDSKFHPSPIPFGVQTDYREEGTVVGRGCSTKDKVFYKECETHSYGDTVEKMCFCSYFLCNGSAGSLGTPGPLSVRRFFCLPVLAAVMASAWMAVLSSLLNNPSLNVVSSNSSLKKKPRRSDIDSSSSTCDTGGEKDESSPTRNSSANSTKSGHATSRNSPANSTKSGHINSEKQLLLPSTKTSLPKKDASLPESQEDELNNEINLNINSKNNNKFINNAQETTKMNNSEVHYNYHENLHQIPPMDDDDENNILQSLSSINFCSSSNFSQRNCKLVFNEEVKSNPMSNFNQNFNVIDEDISFRSLGP